MNPGASQAARQIPWRLALAGVVLAGLLAWLFWPAKKVSSKNSVWAGFKRQQAIRLEVQRPGHKTVVVARQGHVWRLTKPYPAAADRSTLRTLLGELSRIHPARRLGTAADLARYGLQQPAQAIVTLTGGRKLDYEFGGSAPTGEGDYMKLASAPEVVLAPDFIKADALHGAFHFEDKALLHFRHAQVTAVRLDYHGRRVSFARMKGAWPKAQKHRLGDLLDNLQNASANKIVDVTGKNAEKYGLARPAIRVRLTWKGGGGTLEIGKKTASGNYYARSSARPAIVTISSYLLNGVRKLAGAPKAQKKKPAKLRHK